MSKKHRAAIVGLSGIGASPLPPGPADVAAGWAMPHSHAASYAVLPDVEVVAACDLKEELLEQFERNFRDVWPEVRLYRDYREMLEREKPDVLSVVTSDHLHAQIVVDAAERGVRGVFCEKPIATTLADADRMIEACDRHGVVMSVDHSRRWYPAWRAARAQLGKEPLGELRGLVASLGGGRPMLFRNGTHVIDVVCWFADSEPEWVTSVLDEAHWDYGPRYGGGGGKDAASEPGVTAVVQFANGVQAIVNCSGRTAAPGVELDVLGERGRMRVRDLGTPARTFAELSTFQSGDRAEMRGPLAVPVTQRGDTPAALAELLWAMEHGKTTTSPPREARKTLAVILAMLQSQAAGNAPVRFPVSDA